jgi:PRTRC genetic system protein E
LSSPIIWLQIGKRRTKAKFRLLFEPRNASNRRKLMFAELMPLLRKRRLLLTISLVEGDKIRATVVPQKASETEDNALTTPLAITGTAEELDRDLPQQLVEFTGAHLQLQTTLASAKAEMDAAAKAARDEARKKTSKPSISTSPTTPPTPAATPVPREPEAPSLFAQQAQAEPTAAEEEGGEAS